MDQEQDMNLKMAEQREYVEHQLHLGGSRLEHNNDSGVGDNQYT